MSAYQTTTRQIVSGVSASASFTTDVVWGNHLYGAFQVSWASHNLGNAYAKLQTTVDGTNYQDISGTVQTFTSGSSSIVYRLTDIGEPTVRFVYDAGTNTAGTVSVWLTQKGTT
jgi:hypothetical protein